MHEDKMIRRDRMRYVKNSLSATLCYVAILFNIFYFVLLYRSDVGNYYYTIQIGGSIVYNLMFLLIVFLSSEGVKNYNKTYSYILLAAGVMQIVRIFVIPMAAHGATTVTGGEEVIVMQDAQFIKSVIYLCVSAVCMFAAAVANLVKCAALAAHNKALEAQNV